MLSAMCSMIGTDRQSGPSTFDVTAVSIDGTNVLNLKRTQAQGQSNVQLDAKLNRCQAGAETGTSRESCKDVAAKLLLGVASDGTARND